MPYLHPLFRCKCSLVTLCNKNRMLHNAHNLSF
uniref:Uncharacterized protein n=1 Tax=Anguilla anguilla TaxID=7936 RepID=A0A0E9RGA9_ANGAN